MRGFSLTHPVLAFFIFIFYLGSFSYTSHACLLLLWGVSLTLPMLAWILSGEFLLHIPCWLQFYLVSFSYTSRAGFNFIWGVSLTHPVLAFFFLFFFSFFFLWGVCVTRAMLAWFFFLFFLFLFFLFLSYTSHAGFNFLWLVSLTHLVLASILSGEFLLHIPCWLLFYLGTFSYTSRVGFICMRDVSLTHPELVRFLMMDSFFFIWGISLTYPILGWFFFGEFLLHIPCWL